MLLRDSWHKHVQLIKDRRHFEAKIGEMEAKCNRMMVTKFGCAVDMESVEAVTVHRATEELKEKVRQTELSCAGELASYNVSHHTAPNWLSSTMSHRDCVFVCDPEMR